MPLGHPGQGSPGQGTRSPHRERGRRRVDPLARLIALPPRVRRRWIVLAAVVVLVGLLGAAVTAFVFAGSGPSPIEAFVPASASAFAEVRLDAPGDQKVALAQLALRLPGLGRPPDTGDQLAQGIAWLVGTAVGGSTTPPPGTPSTRPWAGPAIGASIVLPGDGSAARLLAIIEVLDAAAARAWVDAYLAAPGGDLDRRHAQIAIVDGSGSRPSVLLAGAALDVAAASSAASGGGLAASDGFRTARSVLAGDELARAYLNVAGLRRWLAADGASRAGWTPDRAATADALLAAAPAWLAARVRAEGDAVLLQTAQASGGGPSRSADDPLAATLPATTIAVIGLRDAGGLASSWLAALRSSTAGAAIDQADGALAGLGGLDGVLGQVGAADLVATWDGTRLAGGLVLRSTTPGATRQLLDSIRALASLAKAPLADEQHGDTTITTAALPGAPDLPLLGSPTVEVAMRGDVVIVGVGRGFAASVLDASAGASLAAQPAYQRAIAKAGGGGVASCYVDVAAARTVGERLRPSAAPPSLPATTAAPQPNPSGSVAPSFDPAVALGALEAIGCSARDAGRALTITVALTVR